MTDEAIDDDERRLANARALLPALRSRTAAANAARTLPDATLRDLRTAGLFRLLQPRRFGGRQASFGGFLRVIDILGEACASTAWVYAILVELEWIIACLPEGGQRDIWDDDPETLAVATTIPRAVATRVAGGWRVSGRQPFASGCRHATWALVGARCQDANGPKAPRYLAVPLRDVVIADDWHTLGMRATGSFSLVLDDVFVPDHRGVTIADIVAGTPPGVSVHPDYNLLRTPRYFLVCFVLPSVGFALAKRALALMPALLRTKEQPASDVVHLRLGEASALIDSACLIFSTRRDTAVAHVESGGAIAAADVPRNRRDVTLAFRMIVQGVEQLVALAGARSIYDSEPLQAIRRDLATIATHISVNEEAAFVPYGRLLLGGT